MERKMDFWTIEIATKFKSKQEVLDLQKNIIDKFSYVCGVHKDYMAQVIVGISNINGKYVKGIYNKSGKVGNNGKAKDIMEETDFTKRMFGTLKVDWHLHILVLSSPSETLAQMIKEYIDKNWQVGVTYKKFKDDNKNDIDIEMLFYIAKQSESVRFIGNSDKRFKYTFKEMYNEMVRQYSNLLFNKRYLMEENYRKKADKKYNDMLKYFSQFYSEELKKKKELEYKKKAKARKIAERYDEMVQRDNKVRKKRSIVNSKDLHFLGG